MKFLLRGAALTGLTLAASFSAQALVVASSYGSNNSKVLFPDPWISTVTYVEQVSSSWVTPWSSVETVGDVYRVEQQSDGSWLGYYNVHVKTGGTLDTLYGSQDAFRMSLDPRNLSGVGANTVNISLKATTSDFKGFQVYLSGVDQVAANPQVIVNGTDQFVASWDRYGSSWDFSEFFTDSILNIAVLNPSGSVLQSVWITSVTDPYNLYHEVKWVGSEHDEVRSKAVAAPATTSVPEPQSLALVLAALVGGVGATRVGAHRNAAAR